MKCSNNLKQIGLALHNYEGTHQTWPMGSKGPITQVNWRVHVLPYMELDNVYRQINQADSYNSTVLRTTFSVWQCPSSPLPPNPTDTLSGWHSNPGHHVPCYIGIMGAYPDPAGRANSTFNSNYGGFYAGTGMLIPNEITRMASCTDGLSNTIVVGEQSGTVGTADLRNRYWTPWGGLTFTTSVSAGNPGDSWGLGLTAVAYRPNSPTAAGGSDNVWDPNTVLNSKHTAGINVLMGDGSVRFVSDNVDFANFQRMCVRDDGLVTTN